MDEKEEKEKANTEITQETPNTPITKEGSIVSKLVMVHKCCGGGFKWFKKYRTEHPELPDRVEGVGIFVARDRGYDVKYGFKLSELEKHVFLIDLTSEKVIAIGDK